MAGRLNWEEKFPPDYLIEACVKANLFTLPRDRPWKHVIISRRTVSYHCKCNESLEIFYRSVTFEDKKEEFYVAQCSTCGRIVYSKL